MQHRNDLSNKQQLTYFLIIVVIILAALVLYINYRPQIRRIEAYPAGLAEMRQEVSLMFGIVKKLAHNDSIQQEQLNRFPTAPLSIEDMSKVSSVYSYREDPVTGERAFHTGIDYRASPGTIVFAAGQGRVIDAKYDGAYGNTVRIDHENGYITTYAHLMNMTVIAGEYIQKGDTIGNVGATGKTTGNHLHYEIAFNNGETTQIINPKYFTQTIKQ